MHVVLSSEGYCDFELNIVIPTLFFKKTQKNDIAIASVRPSVTLSPPKPLDEIQPNVCVWGGGGGGGGAGEVTKRSNIIKYH